MAIPKYDAIFTGNLTDMAVEIQVISEQAGEEMKDFLQENIDRMDRYGVSPVKYKDLT